MSEDVKPKLYYIYEGIAYEINNDRSLLEDVCAPIDRFNMKTIELEPTMRLIEDMAQVLEFCSFNNVSQRESIFQARLILEKYRKFKEGLR